jgi:hypothetical protein
MQTSIAFALVVFRIQQFFQHKGSTSEAEQGRHVGDAA